MPTGGKKLNRFLTAIWLICFGASSSSKSAQSQPGGIWGWGKGFSGGLSSKRGLERFYKILISRTLFVINQRESGLGSSKEEGIPTKRPRI